MPRKEKTFDLSVILLRGLVVFPNMLLTFDVGRQKNIDALEYALANKQHIFITTQTDPLEEYPDASQIFSIGVIAEVKQILRLPGGMVRVFGEGIDRGEILNFTDFDTFVSASVIRIRTKKCKSIDNEAESYIRTAQELFEQYARISGKAVPEIMIGTITLNEIGILSDTIAMNLNCPFEVKQGVLEEIDDLKRLMSVINLLQNEINIVDIQRDIMTKVRAGIDAHQREYFLKEQFKVLDEELNGKDGDEIGAIKARALALGLPQVVFERVEKELKRLSRMQQNAPETSTIRDYLDLILDLPWSQKSPETINIEKAEKILGDDHFGLEKVKERVLEFLAVRMSTGSNGGAFDSPILCLVGPPGVGKTSIAKSIAACLNRKYVRASLGGVRDEADIRGHRKTYIGAMPGRLIAAMKQAKQTNPLILLDEIDKLSSDFKGNPAAALLEALDSEQNFEFFDHYLDLPYDLSDVLFLATANSLETIPYALRDRLEIIMLESYTKDEKTVIAKQFLFEKQLKKHGLNKLNLKVDEGVFEDIVEYYTKEAGVRGLERLIGKLCRKAVKEIVSANENSSTRPKKIVITKANLETYLGKRKYRVALKNKKAEIGIVRGLAWTNFGGDTLSVEVNTMKGDGKFELTGNMGDVMKESAKAAISYIRAQSSVKVPKNFYKNTDIHIHIPEGATPKDGPSAGITMATAMLSALAEIPINPNVCMTGEITIRGRVLPIGGLKEKVLAAKTAGLSTVILPRENESDLNELSDAIRENINFVLADHMDDVLPHVFTEGGWTNERK